MIHAASAARATNWKRDCIPMWSMLSSDGVSIKMEQIRELRKRFRFRPFEGKFRVVIIQEAQKLIEPAANAILKILEEPPKGKHLYSP